MNVNYSLIKSNAELKFDARQRLKGNWGMAILVCFLGSLLPGIPGAIPYIGWIVGLLIGGPFALGLASSFLRLVRNEPLELENLFDGFKNFATAFLAQLLMSIFIFLWSLLLIIPGIIAAYSYSLTFYIIKDNPEIGAMEALRRSKQMMKGFKGKLFLLQLSFIGWALLCILTVGIGFLWLMPYIKTAEAQFYENLKQAYEASSLAE